MDDLLSIVLSNAVAAAVLALLAALTGAVCRRPALVHGLWLLVLLKLVTPPLARIPVVWPRAAGAHPAEVATVATEETRAETTPPPLEQPAFVLVLPPTAEDESAVPTVAATPAPAAPSLWPRLLLLAWLAGSLAWFVLAAARLGRFRRLLRFARRAPAALQARAARLSRRLELSRCPRVGLLPGRIAPMLWSAGGSPCLFVPADLLDTLSDEQLDTLLVHELAHLRRRDHWVRAVEFVVMGLYWWHPIVWYARRELREAEEQCCDAWVVSTLPGAGRTYATALMDTLDFLSTARSAVPPLASGIGQVHDLKRRLTMIMRGTTPRALSWPGYLVMLAVGACFLPLLPALQAQAPAKEEEEKAVFTIRLHDEDAQKAREAKIELGKLQADLKQKLAEVERAKARLKAAIVQAQAQEGKKAEESSARQEEFKRKIVILSDQAARLAGDKKQSTIHIEITLDGDVNVKDLSKKLASILPEKARIQIGESVIGGKGGGVIRFQAKEIHVEPKPLPDKATLHLKVPQPQDKRINDLEKKLEKVLQELQQLRRQMKEPRSGLPPAGDVVVPTHFRFRLEKPGDPPPPPPEPPKRP